jgi:hypothetical protein
MTNPTIMKQLNLPASAPTRVGNVYSSVILPVPVVATMYVNYVYTPTQTGLLSINFVFGFTSLTATNNSIFAYISINGTPLGNNWIQTTSGLNHIQEVSGNLIYNNTSLTTLNISLNISSQNALTANSNYASMTVLSNLIA